MQDVVMEQKGPEAEELQDIFQKLDSFGEAACLCLRPLLLSVVALSSDSLFYRHGAALKYH
jgi:hypothetical protein